MALPTSNLEWECDNTERMKYYVHYQNGSWVQSQYRYKQNHARDTFDQSKLALFQQRHSGDYRSHQGFQDDILLLDRA
jgi:hypothetical protein